MKAVRNILFVIAAFFLIFSFLFILGSGGAGGSGNYLLYGGILGMVGLAMIFIGSRLKDPSPEVTNVSVNIDLPGEVGMDTIKCTSCGGTLSEKDIKMVAGAPVVTCPFCGTTYQLTEKPKW